jgi:hypothetical protein
MGGQIQYTFDAPSVTLNLINSGKIKAIAVAATSGCPTPATSRPSPRRPAVHRQQLDRHAGAPEHAARHRRQAEQGRRSRS